MIVEEDKGAPRRRRRGPALFEAEDPALAAPAPEPPRDDAFPEDDLANPPPEGAAAPAAARAVRAAAKQRGGWGRIVWGAFGALISLAVGVAIYDFLAGLIARNPVLATVAGVLAAIVVAGLIGFALREAAAMARLSKVDEMRRDAERALADKDRKAALRAVQALRRLYAGRRDLDWGLADLKSKEPELFEADSLLSAAERSVLAPLDARAEAAVGRAGRTVAALTAVVPMALVDVAAALYVNLRMIRQIAEIYDGRAGWLGSWRLLKAVAGHLVATGAVAVGEDMLGAAVGGGALAKVSRRFGEGLVNGALTCRVGAAAIAVCRPLPFHDRPGPDRPGADRKGAEGVPVAGLSLSRRT
jgi:putative membrane protein